MQRKQELIITFGTLLLLLLACNPNSSTSTQDVAIQSNTEAQTSETGDTNLKPSQPLVVDLDAIPPVDIAKHSVPLEEIYFDTFRRINRVVPLTDISPDMIRDLRDAIPPIYNPKFETLEQGDDWLSEADIVVGYAAGDEAYAYPVRILNWHEIAAHDVNGQPILATY